MIDLSPIIIQIQLEGMGETTDDGGAGETEYNPDDYTWQERSHGFFDIPIGPEPGGGIGDEIGEEDHVSGALILDVLELVRMAVFFKSLFYQI